MRSTAGGKYRAILTDIEHATILGFLPDRDLLTLQRWFYDEMGTRRRGIEVITTDMYGPYRRLIKGMLPQAHHVVDKFHVLRKANEAAQEARKDVVADAKTRLNLKNSHDLFNRRWNDPKWTDAQRWKMEIWFNPMPVLKHAYEAKERFYASMTPQAMPLRLVLTLTGSTASRRR
jgi:transposase